MPFRGKKQWRWAFATHQAWALKWAHQTKGGKKARFRRLPSKKRSAGSGRRKR